jgi:hypothetical protein
MNRRTARIAVAAATLCSAVALSACGPDRNDGMGAIDGAPGTVKEQPDNKISADVREYAIHVTDHVAKAGDVTFTVTNYGTIQHEFLVIKSDYLAGQIPFNGDKFDEEEKGVENLGETGEFDPGLTKAVTVKLAPGHYQLVCNIPGHYKKGMAIPFEVI